MTRDDGPLTAARPVTAAEGEAADAVAPRRGPVFWIVRYLPAEVSGTAAMVAAGMVAAVWTDVPALIAVVALIAEIVGFYLVLAFVIYVEQARVTPSRRRAVGRTLVLLVAEFGTAELLDTLVVRPAALMLGVWLVPDPVWGMLAGKVAADIVFYAVAAGAFTITAKTGLRGPRRAPKPRAVTP